MNASSIICDFYWPELTPLKSKSVAKVLNSIKYLFKVSTGFCSQVEGTCQTRVTFFGLIYTDSNVSAASLYWDIQK